ncbi:MAG: hypothetical protein U0132_03520 [Gemmatimonadaceae bacterium]
MHQISRLPSPVSSRRRVIAAVLLVVAAFALQRAATGPWGTATAADGAHLQLTVSGLSRLSAGAVTDCRWWPAHGDATLCGPSALMSSYGRVKWAYPLLFVALWASIGCLFLVFLNVPRARWVRAVLTALTGTATLVAVLVMWRDAPQGLLVLQTATDRVLGLGAWLASVGTLSLWVSAGLQATET